MQTITITDPGGRNAVTVPVHPRVDREGACLDLIVSQQLHVGCPVYVLLSLRTDGSTAVWDTRFDGKANPYAHVVTGMNGWANGGHTVPEPTEAQRLTIARWWAGIEYPCGIQGSPGQSLMQWAFAGLDADIVSQRYLNGKRVLLTAPDNEGYPEEQVRDNTPWQKGDDNFFSPCTSCL